MLARDPYLAMKIADRIHVSKDEPLQQSAEKCLLETITDLEGASGMFAAIFFAQNMLYNRLGPDDPGTHILTRLCLQLAHHYLETLEQRVHERSPL